MVIRKGNPFVLGVTKEQKKYHFAVSVPDEKEAYLLLYHKGEEKPKKRIPLPVKDRVGTVSAVCVSGIDAEAWEYNYEIDGKAVCDPYAKVLTGKSAFGEEGQEQHVRCGIIKNEYAWQDEAFEPHALADTILYKLHVRGFTMQEESGVKAKGTFAGLIEKIPYLKKLGATAVELMPAYEFTERETVAKELLPFTKPEEDSRVNYWGYTSSAYYFSPKSAYAYSNDPVNEMKTLIDALHNNQLECIMEFYFDKTVSAVQILEVLRFWMLEYHVDGFHVIGEEIPQNMLREDPILAKTKLFFVNVWDGAGKNGYFKNCAEYHDGFRQIVKRFLKGDDDMLQAFTAAARYNPKKHGTVNYLSVQDGFTLLDSVSYENRHNEANKEGNRDGMRYNYSWNCGEEGVSEKPEVCVLRQKQMKNAALLLLLSQGTPLWYQGDELGNSQNGNNNAYCQDNEIGWVDWKSQKSYALFTDFVQSAMEFRMQHPVLHKQKEAKMADWKELGCPEVSYHNQDAWNVSYENHLHHIGVLYCGGYAEKEDGSCDDSVYILYNMHWNPHSFALPRLPKGQQWQIWMDTDKAEWSTFHAGAVIPEQEASVEVPARTIMVLVSKVGD